MKGLLLLFGLAALPLAVWAADPAPAATPAPADPTENDFFGEGTNTVTETKASTEDPTKQFTDGTGGARIGGNLQADATWNPGWVGGWPGTSGAQWNDGLAYDLLTTTYIDSRPDKNFRVHFSIQAGYPFTGKTQNLLVSSGAPSLTPVSTTSLTVPNIKIWELFTDVTVNDWLYLRFGKQSASWGVSYFYSVADVISLTNIDVNNPTLQREGPLALKATVPFPNQKANLNAFVLSRDSYFTDETASLSNLGYALQGDILVGEAQLSLGGFYQKASAPKLVATVNTGLGALNLPIDGTIDVFTEAILSRGSDQLEGTGSSTQILPGQTTYADLSAWDKTLYYTGTAGISYSNNTYNFSLRGEYLYNPFGSSDKYAASKVFGTYIATQANMFLPGTGTNSASTAFGSANLQNTGIHNLTALFDMTSINSSKLEFSTLYQANLSDGSGWVNPYFTIYPWTQLGFKWGLQFVYGSDGTQYPIQFQAYDAHGKPLGTKWVNFMFEVVFGTGAY